VTPSPKSLILDLLSSLQRGTVPVRRLVKAAQLFGIEENSLRVALARLHRARLVERDERGRYGLGPQAQAINHQVTAWRTLEARMRPWRGGWIAVQTAACSRSDRPALRRRTRALNFLGFRELVAGLEVRPNNLTGGVVAVRSQLRALELEAPVFGLSELGEGDERRARGLWNIRALYAGYAATRRELDESAERLRQLERPGAMVESFLCGGRAIRRLVLDPLLPEPIAPAAPRRALVETMRRYDRLGRACWADYLGVSPAVHRSTPANLSSLGVSRHLAVAAPGESI